MKPAKFLSKSFAVEAMQWTGADVPELHAFADGKVTFQGTDGTFVILVTPGGPMRVEEGEWIVKHRAGVFLPCSAEEFARCYEAEPATVPAITQKTNGELRLDPEAPTDGEYLACGCYDPPEQEGDVQSNAPCGKEAVAVWDIAYMGTIVASSLHACAHHDQGIRQMAKQPPIGIRRPLKRVELADQIADGHTGGVVFRKN